MRFLPSLFDIYSFLFFIYLGLISYLLIRNIFNLKKINLPLLFVFLLSVLIFFIKVKTSFFLDARPTATFEAIFDSGGVKHPYSLALFWKILSWLKYPRFHDVIIYNIFLGSLVLVLCYSYFTSLTKSRGFGFLSFIFLGVSSLFYQATISSEYFLIQLIFSFSFFLALHRLKENTSHTNILLLFLSYFLLALSKIEAFSIIGVLPFLLFMLKRRIKFNILFIFYSCISFLLACFITLSLFSDKTLIFWTLFRSFPMRDFIGGNFTNGYLQFLRSNIVTIVKYFPSESIAFFFLFVFLFIPKRIKTFDLPVAVLIYLPIFIVCFFIHDEGFYYQEGKIKFSYQMIFPFLYGWFVLMWNLLKLFQKKKNILIKITIFSFIIFINIFHFLNASSAAKEYIDIAGKMKINPFQSDPGINRYPHLYLLDSFVYKIEFICDMIRKERLRAIIVDLSDSGEFIYDHIIKEKNPAVLYFPIKEKDREVIQEAFPLILERDLLIVFTEEQDEIYSRLLGYNKAEEEIRFQAYEMVVTLAGISERGVKFLRKYHTHH